MDIAERLWETLNILEEEERKETGFRIGRFFDLAYEYNLEIEEVDRDSDRARELATSSFIDIEEHSEEADFLKWMEEKYPLDYARLLRGHAYLLEEREEQKQKEKEQEQEEEE